MVKYLKKLMVTLATAMVLPVIATIMCSAALADETLPDPTRPPLDEVGGESAVPSAPVLQSVMMSRGHKSVVINGQTVHLGEKFGDAKLVRVTDAEVVLRNSDGTLQALKMYPAVEKRVVEQPKGTPRVGKTRRSATENGANK